MKAILIKGKKATDLAISEYQKPAAKQGFVLIRNKAFGINRAEVYMRKGEFGATHDIIGIELTGIVENDPSGTFQVGQKVVAFVGGLARDFGGSYAEYASVPLQNVIPVETNLPWSELAAIPETFSTAWGVLHWGVQAAAGQSLLVRGATSTVGLATIILAKQIGMTVIATSRSADKFSLLKKYGADITLADNGNISAEIHKHCPGGVSAVIELVGTATLQDSLTSTAAGGTVCVTGFLGGLSPLEHFMPLMQIPGGVKLTALGSAFVYGNKDFPFSAIPVQQIVTDIEQQKISNILSHTFRFDQLAEAHSLMESNQVNGKIVVTV